MKQKSPCFSFYGVDERLFTVASPVGDFGFSVRYIIEKNNMILSTYHSCLLLADI